MIQVQPIDQVCVVRLNRPEKRNALTPKMLTGLVEAIDGAASAHAIVLSGVGEVFCAGFDLSLCRDDDGALADLLTGLSRAIRALRTAPCPVVVSAHGAAIAGGCALLGGGDVIVTDAAAKLGYPVVRLGISPAVSAPFLRLEVGDGPCRARQLDSTLIDGREAIRIGLAHFCEGSPAACEARAIAIAQGLAAKPCHGLAYTKRWLSEVDGSLDTSLISAGLATSLALVGGDEERTRLAEMWSAQAKGKT